MGAPKRIAAAKFKAECLKLLDHLEPEGLVVTKHGRPVARVVPYVDQQDLNRLFGIMKGKGRIKGDILSTGIKWDAES